MRGTPAERSKGCGQKYWFLSQEQHLECSLHIMVWAKVGSHSTTVPDVPRALLKVKYLLLLRIMRPMLSDAAGRPSLVVNLRSY